MHRSARVAPGVYAVPVLNRGVGRMRLFEKAGDYDTFERIVEETRDARPMRVFPQVTRYVERNALRADLIPSAEEWR